MEFHSISSPWFIDYKPFWNNYKNISGKSKYLLSTCPYVPEYSLKKWCLIRSNRRHPLLPAYQSAYVSATNHPIYSSVTKINTYLSLTLPEDCDTSGLWRPPHAFPLWKPHRGQQNLTRAVFLQRGGSREANVNLAIIRKASAQTWQTSHPQSSHWEIMPQGQAWNQRSRNIWSQDTQTSHMTTGRDTEPNWQGRSK